jgi:hypothetical protein
MGLQVGQGIGRPDRVGQQHAAHGEEVALVAVDGDLG